MTAALLLLRRYALPIGIVLALALGWAWHRHAVNTARRQGYEQAQGDMAKKVAEANAKTAAIDVANRKRSDAAATEWETERNALTAQVSDLLSRPRQPLRLCRATPGAQPVPRAAADTSESPGATDWRESDVRMGADIGTAGAMFAARCEEDRLKLIALQDLLK